MQTRVCDFLNLTAVKCARYQDTFGSPYESPQRSYESALLHLGQIEGRGDEVCQRFTCFWASHRVQSVVHTSLQKWYRQQMQVKMCVNIGNEAFSALTPSQLPLLEAAKKSMVCFNACTHVAATRKGEHLHHACLITERLTSVP
eukprot:3461006-Amphidinium_carterae.2